LEKSTASVTMQNPFALSGGVGEDIPRQIFGYRIYLVAFSATWVRPCHTGEREVQHNAKHSNRPLPCTAMTLPSSGVL
jgi:hypothetical protein